jgi:hypothetical protein
MNKQKIIEFTSDYMKDFEKQIKDFHLNKSQVADFLEISYGPLYTWRKLKAPLFTPNMIVKMKKVGWNPMYCFGVGDLTLPGYTIQDVFDNVTTELERIYDERKRS